MQGTSYAYIPSVQNFFSVHYGCDGVGTGRNGTSWEEKLAVVCLLRFNFE